MGAFDIDRGTLPAEMFDNLAAIWDRRRKLFSSGEGRMRYWARGAAISLFIAVTLSGGENADSLNFEELNEANRLIMDGNYEEALPIMESEYRRASRLKLRSPAVAYLMNNLGLGYAQVGRYLKAEKMIRRSLLLHHNVGRPITELVRPMLNLADIQILLGQLDRAEHVVNELLLTSPSVAPELQAIAHNLLGEIHRRTGDLDEALEDYQRAIDIYPANPSPATLPLAGTIWNNMGLVMRLQGDPVDAILLFLRAVAAWETQLGPDHPNLVAAYMNLGAAQADLGATADAEASFLHAIDIGERRLGMNHPLTAKTYRHYAVLLKETGRKRLARAYRKSGDAALAAHSEENLLGHTVDAHSLVPRR